MRFPWSGLLLLQASAALTSFERDVVVGGGKMRKNHRTLDRKQENSIQNALLAKARPLAEYEADLNAKGAHIVRHLEDRQNGNRDGDFYVSYYNMYSFSGYSMKYAKCQPVQYFSEEAIEAGEHSPMVTEDIVILRLCPQKSCSESASYGCHYNYAEYAISLSDYLSIMLKYSQIKQEMLCEWCERCGYDDNAEGEEEQQGGNERRLEEQQQQQQEGQEGQAEAEEEQVDCGNAEDYCYNFYYECGEGRNNDDGENMDFERYQEYLQCSEADYNDYAYFVRPRCDGSDGTIKMAAFYDNYCVQYAGDAVNVKNLGLGFLENQFQEYYSGACFDCSESYEAPYYDTDSALCNKIHWSSAKCTSDLLYDLFDGEEDDSTECSYIESLRYGTYNENGQLVSASDTTTWTTEVSTSQKVMLGLVFGFSVALIIYACYLHHSMTNLLIKSLSHRELLPPSRHRRSRRTSKRVKSEEDTTDEEDWAEQRVAK